MTLREIRELLPLFAAGSLSPQEKKVVEEELSKSNELQEELLFWRQARAISLSESRAAAEHPTAEEITSYARGELRDNKLRSSVESHVQTCQSCSKDLKVGIETYLPGVAKVARASLLESTFQILRRFKLTYAIPILTALIVCILLFWPAPPHLPPSVTPPANHVRFTLHYDSAVRDPNKQFRVPSLTIMGHDQVVDFTIFIPHSGIDGVRYSLDLVDPSGLWGQLSDTVMALRFHETLDTLNIEIHRAQFTQPSGLYRLHITEKLPSTAKEILPEEYIYQFELVSQNGQ